VSVSEQTDQHVTVVLRDLPLRLHTETQAHADELQREFCLVLEQVEEEGVADVPARLLQLISALRGQYGDLNASTEDTLDEAIAAGRTSIDLTYRVPAHAAEAARALNVLLDEADAFCREGKHLLTLASRPGVLAYRQWFLDEFVRQVAGEPPRPWSAVQAR
jgi:hypothetical protein